MKNNLNYSDISTLVEMLKCVFGNFYVFNDTMTQHSDIRLGSFT